MNTCNELLYSLYIVKLIDILEFRLNIYNNYQTEYGIKIWIMRITMINFNIISVSVSNKILQCVCHFYISNIYDIQ